MDMTVQTLILILAGLAVTGIGAGLLAGLLGVGGGIIVVPILFWILTELQIIPGLQPDLAMHIAVATSLAIIIPTGLSSARAHAQKGALEWGFIRQWGFVIIAGAFAGGVAAGYLPGFYLKMIFAIIAFFVALNLFFAPHFIIAKQLPTSPLFRYVTPLLIGLISAMMGIGGGTLTVPVLIAFSWETRRAVATAAAFGVLIAVPGAIGFVLTGYGLAELPDYQLGYISLPAFLAITPFSAIMAPFGAKLAHYLPQARLKQIFAIFLMITAVKFFL